MIMYRSKCDRLQCPVLQIQRMKADSSYSSNRGHLDISTTGFKASSQKYKYSLQPQQIPRRNTQTSQFSPYKQIVYPHKEIVPVPLSISSLHIREFSPYSTKKYSPPRRYFNQIENHQKRSNILIENVKETDYKILQHNAMTRQHIIEQLTLMNHQLKDQINFYKQLIVQSEENNRISKERMGLEYEALFEINMRNQSIIQQQKEDIRVLLLKNQQIQIQQESLRQQQIKSNSKQKGRQKERSRGQEGDRSKSRDNNSKQNRSRDNINDQAKNESNVIDEIEQIINREYASNRYLSEFICCKRSTKGNIHCLLKRLSKVESFARSIIEMRNKIEKQRDSDLKKTWRWLKGILESALKYRKLQSYESALSKKLRLSEQSTLQQMIIQLLK